MSESSPRDPEGREILVNLGNRWVVFGSPRTLPRPLRFGPKDADSHLPRVADETEHAEERIAKTLRVLDATARRSQGQGGPDIELVYPDGQKTLIEIKIRERDPKQGDYAAAFEKIRKYAPAANQHVEIWYLNLESLKLHIVGADNRGKRRHWELSPLNVWEFGSDGQPFERSRVVDRVEDWARRLETLYTMIEEWVAHTEGLRAERVRAVEMSEELMQKYAVPDRELPVLDIIKASEPILSFVPRALWVLGAKGRVDIITRAGTRMLVAGAEPMEWHIAGEHDRRELTPFDEVAFTALVQPQ